MILFFCSPISPDNSYICNTEERLGSQRRENPTSCQSWCHNSNTTQLSLEDFTLALVHWIIYGGICIDNLPSRKLESSTKGIRHLLWSKCDTSKWNKKWWQRINCYLASYTWLFVYTPWSMLRKYIFILWCHSYYTMCFHVTRGQHFHFV